MPLETSPLKKSALGHWDAGKLDLALADAWVFFDTAPDNVEGKHLLAGLLRAAPELIAAERGASLLGLIRDPEIDPASITGAGWHFVCTQTELFGGDMAELAAKLEQDELALALLEETSVRTYQAEESLTQLRRRLLVEDRWHRYPRVLRALSLQASHNGGAWLFDEEERRLLDANRGAPIAAAYGLVTRQPQAKPSLTGAVTRAVAGQYEGWPYPQWERVTVNEARTLADDVRKLDPDGPDTIPATPQILIAGCGTGRQVALAAQTYPDARITAIDFSAASLDYAADRLAKRGIAGIELKLMDLHDVAALGREFDAIFCTGVLHHLADPEKGWAALSAVLKPGGVMHMMMYSKLARLRVRGLRTFLKDLVDRPVDDDLLREVRRRLIVRGRKSIPQSLDFYSLAGVHDLLMHRHEDPFDVPRIRRALEALDMQLIGFRLRDRPHRARYIAENPGDPLLRDYGAWSNLEKREPALFSAMYDFWCRKPAG